MTLLEVANLCAGYGKVQALFGCSFSVTDGEFAVLLGANGAGKTTTLQALSGILPATGDIRYAGASLAGVPAHRRVGLGLVQITQGRGTFNDFTVDENLSLGAITVDDPARIRADKARWYEIFPRLAERRRHPAGSLSGGEQQMLALARALMARPRLLMCDEPSLGLAPAITDEIFDILGKLNREHGLTLLVVEQNAELSLRHADTALVMEAGHIVARGSAEEMLSHDEIQKSYLGV
jgi:branched-chain amino acid transport system ATP-binding protein